MQRLISRDWLSAIGYRLLAIGYWLLAIPDRQIERVEQLAVVVHPRVRRGQELVSIENRIRPSEKAERLCLPGQPRPSR